MQAFQKAAAHAQAPRLTDTGTSFGADDCHHSRARSPEGAWSGEVAAGPEAAVMGKVGRRRRSAILTALPRWAARDGGNDKPEPRGQRNSEPNAAREHTRRKHPAAPLAQRRPAAGVEGTQARTFHLALPWTSAILTTNALCGPGSLNHGPRTETVSNPP